MSDIAIRAENLSKLYHIGAQQRHDTLRDAVVARLRHHYKNAPESQTDFWALKGVSFHVKTGEVVGVIGRNGAGKSTLLKVLSHITEPTSGHAEIHGRVASLLEVGTGFHPELTGRENIYLNGAILGMHRQEIAARFDEIVAFSEIEKFLDTPVKRYSSGMYVRLAFAVAAHLEPEILLVDEVLAVGDAQFQKKCLGKMGDVAKAGRTVLFVSHNLVALRSLCPRAMWLTEGQVKEVGSSQDVVADYLKLQATKVHERVWNELSIAPGNDTVRLHRVWIDSGDDSVDGGIPREAPMTIGVEYWHLDPGAQLHITLHVQVEEQVVAFTTASSHDLSWEGVSRQQGLLRSTCRVPADFLNTGQHRVRLLVIKDRAKSIFSLDDALAFEVLETAERAGSYFGKEPGVVRPRLPWHNQYLGSAVGQGSQVDLP